MGLSQAALRELRSELANLKRYRGELEAQVHGIEMILARRSARSAAPAHAPETELALARPGDSKGSLRSRITGLLQQTSGLRTSELAERLHQEGFRVGGATSLRERVSHELSRLRSLKLVRRRRGGRYTLARRGKDSAAGASKSAHSEATA